MTIPEFFIKRPVFATILNLLIVVVGVLGYVNLRVSEYPEVTVPELTVVAVYPNASADEVEKQVTFELEDALAGIEGLEKITSATTAGESNIGLTFKEGVSIDRALAMTRDQISFARSHLPNEVKEPKIRTSSKGQAAFLYITLTADGYTSRELRDIAQLSLKNFLRSIEGVSTVEVHGVTSRMSVGLDKLRLYNHKINPDEVIAAIEKFQESLPAGEIRKGVPLTIELAPESVEDFENIIVKQSENAIVRLRDVADVKFTGKAEEFVSINAKPGAVLAVRRASDGNPLMIAKEIEKAVPKMKAQLPKGVEMEIFQYETDFIQKSLDNIQVSILEATVLVVLIIFLFLRNIRAILIPLVAIPISLIGALGVMYFVGSSLNVITLLALVLSIGIVVDDAIVVLENIHRHLEAGLSPLEAAMKGGRELGFAIIAMTLTLVCVYFPIAFIKGTIGQIFIEFAITLVAAVTISGIVAMVLSPMMCSRILKSDSKEIMPWVDRFLKSLERGYEKVLRQCLRFRVAAVAFTVLMIGLSAYLYLSLPGELVPKEDRGFFGVFVEEMRGYPKEKMERAVSELEAHVAALPEVEMGLSFRGDWGSQAVAILTDDKERNKTAHDMVEEMRITAMDIPSLAIWPSTHTSGIPGLEGNSNQGGDIEVQLQTLGSFKDLRRVISILLPMFEDDEYFSKVSSSLGPTQLTYRLDIDQNVVSLLGLENRSISKALQVMLKEDESLRFKKGTISYPIEIKSKEKLKTIDEIYITTQGEEEKDGEQISLGALGKLEETVVPSSLSHYNQLRSATLSASLKKGARLQDGLDHLQERLDAALPENFRYEFTGAAEKQEELNSHAILLLGFAMIFIYAFMAIQFESFTNPLIILLTVPLACVGGFALLHVMDQSVNMYTQIGTMTLMGLISKHGILIVEFANKLQDGGMDKFEAVVEASKIRLRPILMTTLSTVIGHFPLLLATGAGSEARQAIGYVLIGGLSFGTILTLLIIPTIYLVFSSSRSRVNV